MTVGAIGFATKAQTLTTEGITAMVNQSTGQPLPVSRSGRPKKLWVLGARKAKFLLTGLACLVGLVTYPLPARAVTSYSGHLNDVSCPSATFCMAVGFIFTGTADHTLAIEWNGASWVVIPSPNVGSGNNRLNGVSCLSASSCISVGTTSASTSPGATLIERWDGLRWSVMNSPVGIAGDDNQLFAVSCVNTSFCTAVGSAYSGKSWSALISQWNGAAWSLITPRRIQNLSGVSCVSSDFCIAVGVNFGTHWSTVLQRWNGTSWRDASPKSGGTSSRSLTGVSCTSASFCTAVGFQAAPKAAAQTLIETWNGAAWTAVSSPNRSGTSDTLIDVSCTGTNFCMAAGDASGTLTELWNGSGWTIVPSPFSDAWNVGLTGASCASPSFCVATGLSVGLSTGTITAGWDGNSWNLI